MVGLRPWLCSEPTNNPSPGIRSPQTPPARRRFQLAAISKMGFIVEGSSGVLDMLEKNGKKGFVEELSRDSWRIPEIDIGENL